LVPKLIIVLYNEDLINRNVKAEYELFGFY